MVQGNSEAVCNDIVFVVEGTAACGAYLSEIKSNYILPTIEYFNGGTIQEDKDCGSETFATLYTLVVYHAADRMPAFLVDVYGPFRNPHKFLQLFDKLDFSGGHAENMAALTEGMATALHCFKDLAVLRDPGLLAQKYCILICNSPPYSIGVMDVPGYQGQTLEQLATQITENNIQLSIISPRRLPTWVHLFDKAGGDSATANTKHYAKDLRHLVMLTGYSLQESVVNQPPVATVAIPPVPTSPHGSSPSQQPTIRPPAVAPAAVRPPQPQQNQPLQRPVVPFGINMGNPTSSQNVTITNNVPPMMTQDSGPRIRGPNPRWPAPNQGQPMQVPNQMQQQQQQQPQHIQAGQIAGQMRQPNQVQLQPSIQNPLQNAQQVLLQNQQQQANVQQGVQVMNQNPIQNVVLQQQTQQPMGTNTMQQPHVQQGMPQQGQAPGQMMVNPQQQGIRPFGPQVNQGVNVNQGQVGAIPPVQIVNQQQQQQIMNQQQQQALAVQRQQQAQAQLLAQQQQQQAQQQQQQQQQQPQTQPLQQQQQNMNFPNPNVNIGMANQQIPTAVGAPVVSQQVQQQVQQPQPGQQQPGATTAPANPARERQYIWQGMLEWQEKTRDPQKMARHVPCQVSAAVVNGDTEVKADHWPQKLLMQLIPKSLISNFGGAHFRNARSVMFHPQECEALEALAKVMSTGYAGCVHFTGMVNPLACEIKVLMLLYSPDKKAYIGFIPNDQAGFVDRIRKVIQQQKNKQGQPPGQPPGPGQPGPAPNQIAQQQPGANILVTQTNPLAMGGGQLSATSQPQQQPQMIQQTQQPTPIAGPTMAGPPVRGVAQTPAQLEAERQQNLMTIKKLQETLEAAQQKEVQLKEQQQRRAQIQMQQQMQMQHQIQPQQQMQQTQQQQAQPQQIQNMQQPGAGQAGMMGGQVMNSGVGGVNIQQQQMTQQQMQLQQQQQQMAQQMQQQQRNIRPATMQSNNPGNNPGLRNLLQQQQYRPPMMQQPNTQNRMQQPNVNLQQQQQQQNQGGSQFDNLSLADLLQ